MTQSLWLALALVLVIEGFFLLASPVQWRRVFVALLQLSDGQLRFCGLCAVVLGAAGVWVLA